MLKVPARLYKIGLQDRPFSKYANFPTSISQNIFKTSLEFHNPEFQCTLSLNLNRDDDLPKFYKNFQSVSRNRLTRLSSIDVGLFNTSDFVFRNSSPNIIVFCNEKRKVSPTVKNACPNSSKKTKRFLIAFIVHLAKGIKDYWDFFRQMTPKKNCVYEYIYFAIKYYIEKSIL